MSCFTMNNDRIVFELDYFYGGGGGGFVYIVCIQQFWKQFNDKIILQINIK